MKYLVSLLICLINLPLYGEKVIFPIIMYSPDTGVGAGAFSIIPIKEHTDKKEDQVRATLIVTEKKQNLWVISPNFYFGNSEKWKLESFIIGRNWPTAYFGQGNETLESSEETFKETSYKYEQTLSYYLSDNFKAQFLLGTHRTSIDDLESSSALLGLSQDELDYSLYYLGYGFEFDNRNSIFYSESGFFIQYSNKLYDSNSNSEYKFKEYKLDIRNYIPITAKHSIAQRIVWGQIDGDKIPLQNNLGLGGSNLLRGYNSLRFRGNQMASYQIELRSLYNKWGHRLFYEIGKAYDNSSTSWQEQEFNHSYGVGFQYIVRQKDRSTLRLDFGFTEEGRGTYFTFGQTY